MGSRDGRASLGEPVVEATVDEDESPTEVVLSAAAAVSNAELIDLPPLYDTIDPEALDALFACDPEQCTVTFDYLDYVVVVTTGDVVEVYEPDGG